MTVDGQLPVATFTVDPAPGGLSPAIFLAASPGDPPIGIDTGFTFDLDARGVTADTLVEFVCIGSDGFAVPFFFAGELVLSAEFTAVAPEAPPPPPQFLISVSADGVISVPEAGAAGAVPRLVFFGTQFDFTLDSGVFSATLSSTFISLVNSGTFVTMQCIGADDEPVPFLANGATEPTENFNFPLFSVPPPLFQLGKTCGAGRPLCCHLSSLRCVSHAARHHARGDIFTAMAQTHASMPAATSSRPWHRLLAPHLALAHLACLHAVTPTVTVDVPTFSFNVGFIFDPAPESGNSPRPLLLDFPPDVAVPMTATGYTIDFSVLTFSFNVPITFGVTAAQDERVPFFFNGVLRISAAFVIEFEDEYF